MNPVFTMVGKPNVDRFLLLNSFQMLCPDPAFTWAKKVIADSKTWASKEQVDEFLLSLNPVYCLLQIEPLTQINILEHFKR
mmetsp:Transcript_31450/g.40450  ORF Transcript_31450/g.40450 Transcript_31450/m.40450 type:complete len:81 (+) Transcript_31450:339-581(+)